MIFDTPESIAMYRIAALRQALRLEIAGMRRSRGRSAYSIIKAEFGFKGSRQSVYEQITEHMLQTARRIG